MYVFLDTNIFHNNWFLRSAPLRLLFHYLNNESGALIVSRLVIQEVENLHRRALEEAYRDIRSISSTLSQLAPAVVVEATSHESVNSYDLKSVLVDRAECLEIVEYEGISQTLIAERAMLKIRPFRENEKGFRDTLIWISLLDYLKENRIAGDVFFITGNTSDFMGANKGCFHDDLLQDITSKQLLCNLQLVTSLQEFLRGHVDSHEHALDRNKAENEFSRYLEENAVQFLQHVESRLASVLSERLFSNVGILANSSPITAEIVEGLEDFYFVKTEDLGNNEVYVSCLFELRIVELKIDMSAREFENHRDLILSSDSVYDADQSHGIATVIMYVRPGFLASFTYNQVTEECNGFSVEKFSLVEKGRRLKNLFPNTLK
ncbi:hypothetical protein PS662_00640 [Pseudomonas fluorescens]|uniref:DUF4935 domain-containing protein n=1 Tax=Pseudomonas fluorescens TaxID=294 RepID=A0A5E6PWL8_PSEFL|nr:PIN domain-containing protein [Pseudomonas fluorescens]VVM48051.1 hypothetical protein PS662_00640 [Pseudomonas fluorescens]